MRARRARDTLRAMHARPRDPRRTRIAFLVLGVPLALVAIAWVALALWLPPAKARLLMQAQAARALNREVRFDDASVGLFPPVRLTVKGVALAEPGGLAEGVALQAHAIHLDLDLFALFAGRVVVRRLTFDHPALHLVLRADGTTNLDGLTRAPGAGAPRGAAPELSVRAFEVVGGQVLLDDLRARRRVAFGLDTRTSLAVEGGQRLATAGTTVVSGLALGPLTAARLSDLDRSLAKVRWRVAHQGKYDGARRRLALGRLALAFGRSELALSGVVDDPGPRARVDFRARGAGLELRELLAMLAVADARALHGLSGAGRLGFDLGITGSLAAGSAPAITGTLALGGAWFRYPEAPLPVKDLAFTARFTPDRMEIGDLRATVASQPVRATLAVTRFADPNLTFSLRGDLDLAAVAPLVAPPGVRLGGRANVDVRGRGRARDPGSLSLEGGARLSKVSVTSPDLPKPVEEVNGELTFSPASATVRALTARAGRSSFTLDATVTRPLALLSPPGKGAPAGVRFTLDSPYLDLGELLPPTPGPTLLPNAEGGGRVRIGRLKSQRLDVTDVSAEVTMTPTRVTVPSFALRGYQGRVSGRAAFDLRDPASPGFQVKATADSVSADGMLAAWTPVKGLVRGVMSADLDLAGDGTRPEQLRRSLTANGLASLFDGQIGPGPVLEAIAAATGVAALKEARFKNLALPFQVERGRVTTREVELKSAVGDWRIAGAAGFDGALDYAVSITLPPEQVARVGARAALAAGALSDAQGRLLIDLRIGGTAQSPRVTWDAGAMRARVAGRASEAIAEQRTKLEADLRAAVRQRLQEAARDSVKQAVGGAGAISLDSLRTRGKDLLRGFFGGARSGSPPPPPPAVPAAPSAPPADTTAR